MLVTGQKCRKSCNRFLKVAKVGEFETDVEREFQIFGPRYKILNCLIFVRQKCDL